MSGYGRSASRTIDWQPDDEIGLEEIDDHSSRRVADAPGIDDLNALTTLAIAERLIAPDAANAFARTLMRAYRASLTHRQSERDTAPIHLSWRPVHYPPDKLRLAILTIDAALHDSSYLDGIPAEQVLARLVALTTPSTAQRSSIVASRHRAPAPRMPRVLNKHRDAIPPGAVYCGRGSPWGNPFHIGRDGTRDAVCERFAAEILPTLDVTLITGRDLVCFCAPKRCHCDDLVRAANPVRRR